MEMKHISLLYIVIYFNYNLIAYLAWRQLQQTYVIDIIYIIFHFKMVSTTETDQYRWGVIPRRAWSGSCQKCDYVITQSMNFSKLYVIFLNDQWNLSLSFFTDVTPDVTPVELWLSFDLNNKQVLYYIT